MIKKCCMCNVKFSSCLGDLERCNNCTMFVPKKSWCLYDKCSLSPKCKAPSIAYKVFKGVMNIDVAKLCCMFKTNLNAPNCPGLDSCKAIAFIYWLDAYGRDKKIKTGHRLDGIATFTTFKVIK